MAPVMLLVYTKQRAGVFSFQQLMPPGIKPPQHCASPGNPACRRYYCNQPFNSPSPPHFQNSTRPARSPAERSDAGMSTEQSRGRRKRLALATNTKKPQGFIPAALLSRMCIGLRRFFWILILIDCETRHQLATILFQLWLQLRALAKAAAAAGVERTARWWIQWAW